MKLKNVLRTDRLTEGMFDWLKPKSDERKPGLLGATRGWNDPPVRGKAPGARPIHSSQFRPPSKKWPGGKIDYDMNDPAQVARAKFANAADKGRVEAALTHKGDFLRRHQEALNAHAVDPTRVPRPAIPVDPTGRWSINKALDAKMYDLAVNSVPDPETLPTVWTPPMTAARDGMKALGFNDATINRKFAGIPGIASMTDDADIVRLALNVG